MRRVPIDPSRVAERVGIRRRQCSESAGKLSIRAGHSALIIERYLGREVLRTCAVVLAVLVLVYGADRFSRILSDAAAGAVSPDLILRILALKLVEKLPVFLPLALYLAVLIGLGRLYRDSEVVAFGAGGIGLWRLSRGIFRVVAGFSLAGAALSLFVSPSAASMRSALLEQAKHQAENRMFVPGRFKEFGGGDQVIYVEAVDPESGRMTDVFVRVRKPHRQYVLVAGAAWQDVRPEGGARYMVLENGYRYAGLPGDALFSVTRFERHAVRIEAQAREAVAGGRKVLATTALIGSRDPGHLAELQRRISAAVSIVVLGMLAVPLARTTPREGRYGRLFLAVVVYFLYSNAISIVENLAERGMVPQSVGVWPVHAAMALVVLALLLAQTTGARRLGAKVRSARHTYGEGASQ